MITLKLLLVFSILWVADPLISIKSVSAFGLLNSLPSLSSALSTVGSTGTPSLSCVLGGSSMCSWWVCQPLGKISTGRCVKLPGMRSKECECLDQDNVNQDYSLRWINIRFNNLKLFSGYTGLYGWLNSIFNPNNFLHNHRIKMDSPTLLGLITALRPHVRWDFEFCRKLLYGLSWGKNVPSNKIDELAKELFNNFDGKNKEEQLNLLSKIITMLNEKIPLSYNPTYIETLLNSLLPENKSEASSNSDDLPSSENTNATVTTKSLSQYGVPKDFLQNSWTNETSSGRSLPERTINFIKRIFLRVFPRQPIQSEIPLNRDNVKILINIFTFQPDLLVPDSKLDNVIENLKTKLKLNVSSLPLTEDNINSFLQTISNDKVNSINDFQTSTNVTKSELASSSNEKPLITRSSENWEYNPSESGREEHFPRTRIRLNVVHPGDKKKNISYNASDRDHENNNSNTKFTFKITDPKNKDVKKTMLLTAKDLEPIEKEGKSVDVNKVDKITPTVSLKDIPVSTQPIKIPNAKLSVGLKRKDDMDVTPADPDLKKINTNVRIHPVELQNIATIKSKHLDTDIKPVEHGGLNLKPQDASKSRNFDLHIANLDQSPKYLPIPSKSPSSGKDVDLESVNIHKLDGNKLRGSTKPVQNEIQPNKLRDLSIERIKQPSSSIENQKEKVPTVSQTGRNHKYKIYEPVDGERKSSKSDEEKEEIDPSSFQKDSDVSKTKLNLHLKTVGDAGKNGNKQDVVSVGKTVRDGAKPNNKINLNPVDKAQRNEYDKDIVNEAEDQRDVFSKSKDIKSNKKVNLQPTDKAYKKGNNQKVTKGPDDQRTDESSELIDSKLNKQQTLKSSENEISNKTPSSANNEASSNKTHETSDKKGKVDHNHGKKSPSIHPPVPNSVQPLPTPMGTLSDGSVAYFISDEEEEEEEKAEYEEEGEEEGEEEEEEEVEEEEEDEKYRRGDSMDDYLDQDEPLVQDVLPKLPKVLTPEVLHGSLDEQERRTSVPKITPKERWLRAYNKIILQLNNGSVPESGRRED
uniref:Uncharacterized protein n=1 Tax=Cacopsylla melanoneura TaxID=428564 RepID=A0A8D8LGS5_9HEMI